MYSEITEEMSVLGLGVSSKQVDVPRTLKEACFHSVRSIDLYNTSACLSSCRRDCSLEF